MSLSNIRGNLGEKAVASFLEKQGFEILEKNYKCRYGEIDIISQKAGVIHFGEVKTRTVNSLTLPREAVDLKKQRKIILTAALYFQSINKDFEASFDVYEVILNKGVYFNIKDIIVFENAFCLDDKNSRGLNLL